MSASTENTASAAPAVEAPSSPAGNNDNTVQTSTSEASSGPVHDSADHHHHHNNNDDSTAGEAKSHPVDLTAGGEDGHGTITLRALISTKEAGIIIGKAGETVAKLRDQTKVKAGVSKVVSGVQDRVLSITGTVDQIAEVRCRSFVEQCLSLPPRAVSCLLILVSPLETT